METKSLKLAALATLAVLPLTSQAAPRCYAYVCPPEQPIVSNCDPSVIAQNLEKLNSLNIVAVSGLAAYAPRYFGYHQRVPELQDTCDKAEALAKAVTLLAPLAVTSQE